MKIGDINSNTILYQYEYVNEDIDKFTLCEYRLLKHEFDRVFLENQITKKFTIQSQETFDKNFSSTVEDAALKAVQYLNCQIMNNNKQNLEFHKIIQKILSPHTDSWCNLEESVA